MAKKKINLALQGGGAHGAFNWGILDFFLESDLFTIEAISATSAGSMNAVVLAEGLLDGGNEGARKALRRFWRAMSDYGKLFNLTATTPIDFFFSSVLKEPMAFLFFSSLSGALSPYQLNPLNFNPIREVLRDIVDFKKIREQATVKLFICATNVKTGKIKIFNREELTIDAVLASACLPKVFQAVEIDNEYYWDGGYLGNPAIFPLIYNTDVNDIVILHTVPIERREIPKDVHEIDARLREVSFNSSLMREMRAIAFVTKMVEDGWIKDEYKSRLKKLNIHCLRADHSLLEFGLASVFSPEWEFLTKLFDLGRLAAEEWMQKNYESIGKKTTIDFNEWL